MPNKIVVKQSVEKEITFDDIHISLTNKTVMLPGAEYPLTKKLHNTIVKYIKDLLNNDDNIVSYEIYELTNQQSRRK